LLRQLSAKHIVNGSSPTFEDELTVALEETDATLAFDAIGGGRMASQILLGMERVQSRKLASFSRYGSPVHKQVYIYGVRADADRSGRRYRLGRRRLADNVVLPEDRS
jgi:NADPH2:quinone reductase